MATVTGYVVSTQRIDTNKFNAVVRFDRVPLSVYNQEQTPPNTTDVLYTNVVLNTTQCKVVVYGTSYTAPVFTNFPRLSDNVSFST